MPTNEEIHSFSMMISDIASNKNISVWEALTEYCEQTEIEPQVAASLISKPLKEELRVEVQDLNLLKTVGGKNHKLPL